MIAFTFDGRRIDAEEGQTIAAALTAAGILALGRRRDGNGRGLWCGMGVCQECVVTVDGVASRRACVEKAAQGMTVTAQDYCIAAPAHNTSAVRATVVERPQILVVGAGPAGLAAARAAALCGAKVTIADERAIPGGQYYKQRAVDRPALDAQMREGRNLIAQIRDLGVTLLSDTIVWGAFGARELAASVASVPHLFAPDRLVLATGSYERGLPIPGWTLPGYMTTGAAQTLLRAHGVAPGKRVLVAGNGPLNFQLASELVDAGVEVVAVVEAAKRPRTRDIFAAIAAAPGLMAQGLRYVARLRRADVPIVYESAVISAHGVDRVETCSVAHVDGTAQDFAVDAVCVGQGFLASNQLARAIGCAHRYHGKLETITDGDGLTSIPGVYAIGDGAAFRGAHVARLQGYVTGCAVARSLGLTIPHRLHRELRHSARRLKAHTAFQRALWRMFEAPVRDLANRDTIVCRCENVTRGAMEDAIAAGAATLGEIKRRTRAAMGRCQGRYCEPAMLAMLRSPDIDELTYLAPRIPVVPVRIKDAV